MRDAFADDIIDLYKEKNWKEIVTKYHDHPERSKVLWVFPTEDNFQFLKECLDSLACDKIMSVGCGTGLLEWMIREATGMPVSGVEVDSAWWNSKYAPPTFISLLLTSPELDMDTINILQNSMNTALMFCYFNNRSAFEEYIKHFSGTCLIIIGPGDDKGVHTDPKPFNDVSEDWTLYKWQEVRSSRDFIAVYCKKLLNSIL